MGKVKFTQQCLRKMVYLCEKLDTLPSGSMCRHAAYCDNDATGCIVNLVKVKFAQQCLREIVYLCEKLDTIPSGSSCSHAAIYQRAFQSHLVLKRQVMSRF